MLNIKSINSYYGQIRALKDISLHVEEGEIVALIGANGAGKTTLLNSISGLLPPRDGQITFQDTEISKRSAEQIVGLGISHVPEHRQLFDTMTVYDNLILGSYHRYRRTSQQELAQDIEQIYQIFPILEERQEQLAGTLSGGEQQMVAMGRGLMAKPKLILLDEPSLGLAPLITKEVFRVIAQLRDVGQTVLLVEQNARAALKLADRAYVLETGNIILEGNAKDMLADERVQAAYLGGKR